MTDTKNKEYKLDINLSGSKLPEHEIEVFMVILKHMFNKFTDRIGTLMKEPKNVDLLSRMVDASNKRRDTLALMECCEGLRGYPDKGFEDGVWIKINGLAISEQMLDMVRCGCETFTRDTMSEHHGMIARYFKCRITPSTK